MQQATCAHSGANPVASPGNIDHTTAPSRRALLGFAGLGAFAIAMPIATPSYAGAVGRTDANLPTPFRIAVRRLEAATSRFEGLSRRWEAENPELFEREQDDFMDAVRGVEVAPVANFREFVELFQLACDDGDSLPNDDTIMKLAIDARRLLSGAA